MGKGDSLAMPIGYVSAILPQHAAKLLQDSYCRLVEATAATPYDAGEAEAGDSGRAVADDPDPSGQGFVGRREGRRVE